MQNRRALLIAGPTASGKSALAIALARRLDGWVINTDSMQVYQDLRILSARPSVADENLADHRLFGVIDGAVNYSVGRFLTDAAAILSLARKDNKTPIFVGGTGLYFKALTQGMSDIPAVPDEVRQAVRQANDGVSPTLLHQRLAMLDPDAAARLKPTDSQRIMRALEVHAATGQPLSSFQGRRTAPILAKDAWSGFFLAPERPVLHAAINQRFRYMIEKGALAEVERLAARKLDPALPIMRAHGVPGLIAYLAGDLTLDEAILRGQGDTRAYSKRQLTFARHQLPDFSWIPPEDCLRILLDSYVGRSCNN